MLCRRRMSKRENQKKGLPDLHVRISGGSSGYSMVKPKELTVKVGTKEKTEMKKILIGVLLGVLVVGFLLSPVTGQGFALVRSVWVSGSLVFEDLSGNDILTIAPTGVTFSGNITGDGASVLVGYVQNVVVSSTATLTIAQSGSVVTNFGTATLCTFTLPSAAAGLTYTFVDDVEAAGGDLWITAGTGDSINGGTAAKSYKCVTDSVKQCVTLKATSDSEWSVTAEAGTWANDNS